MLKIGMMLLTILTLSGCRSVTRSMICDELKKHEIAPLEKCTIDMKLSVCRCRIFNINNWTTIGTPANHPLEYCDGIQGFRTEVEAVEVRPKVKAMYRLKENLCQ